MLRHTTDLLQEALVLHRRGAVAEAAARYSAVLQAEPHHADAHYYLGLIACQQGRFSDGAERAREALSGDPSHAPAHVLLGRALAALGQHEEALASFDRALVLAPDLAQAHGHRADALSDLGRHGEAVEAYDRALATAPDRADDWFNRGVALAALDRHVEAVASFERALAGRPDDPQAHLSRARSLSELGRHEASLGALDRALAIAPSFAEAWQGRGNVCLELKQYDHALSAFEKALALKPALAGAWLGRGNVLRELKRYGDAFAAYDQALTLDPELAGAWLGHGNVFVDLKRYDEAFAAYDKALALRPDLARAWLGRGNIFVDLSRYSEAFAAYDTALALRPDLAEAWLGRGNVLVDLKSYDEAFAAYGKALALRPDLAEAWLGRGNVFADLKRYDEAFAAYDKALALRPDLAEAWLGRGNAFADLKRYDEAFAAYDKALALKPNLNYAAASRVHAKMHLCDWTNLNAEAAEVLSISAERVASDPFSLLAISSSPSELLQCTRRYVKQQPRFAPLWRGERYSHDRIRLAYVSSDFREHPIAYLMAGMFEHHDRSRFEVTGISLGAEQERGIRQRLQGAFDHFIDVRTKSDQEIAMLLREREIDIAVDLVGFLENARTLVFARRTAPIQVNYIGFPGTLGADYFDYIIADPTVLPPEHVAFYTEKVAWLPDTYLPTDATRALAEVTPTRGELGLPERGFVFCSFNNSYKFNEAMFDVWMRLLREVEGSVLWLRAYNATATRNLRAEAERRGVAPERLIFAPRAPLAADHLARQRQADLFLDTLPYNAHTTATEALWVGLPVLTCLGSTFAGRVAGGVNRAVGMPELVTTSLAEYEALALKIATDPALCAELKQKLARNRQTHPLFDTARFTRHLEEAYTTMVDILRRGESPRGFSVQS